MRNELKGLTRNSPRPLQALFLELFDWLDRFEFKKERSVDRSGKPGGTVKFTSKGNQVCSLQVSPARDIHLHFGTAFFAEQGLLEELREIIFLDIQPHVVGDSNGTALWKTKSGQKIILTGSDLSIAATIVEKLTPLFDRIRKE
ncbi:MAG: hypothetical protein IPK01_00510 [Acidobacteria bacterium]|nr:hypothetical protein [Acidobacteriota bacterium]